jgi:putative nucleotidyltransferase with HDIG domain
MSNSALRNFLRLALRRALDWLDRGEAALPRSQKERWYQKEFHFPPVFIGGLATLVLYAVLVLNAQINILQAVVLALFVIVVVALFVMYLLRDQPELARSDDAMALLSVLFFLALISMKAVSILAIRYPWVMPFAAPVALAPLLTTMLLSTRLGMVVAFSIGLIHGLVTGLSLPVAMVSAMGGAAAVAFATRAKTTRQVAQTGLVVGVVQMLVVFFLAVLLDWPARVMWIGLGSALASGFLAGMISIMLLPYLESFFSRMSNIRLLELAAASHPLLQKMSIEAPGTYHHSMIMAVLAEDAGNAIGANGLLCRVGAYFHDIGKMVKAEYFIENQGTFGNPHDQVSPSLSRLVITSHVKEGMALARANKLDVQIADFIPQHHGTSKIEYFYQKALKLEEREDDIEQEDITEESYRYPGPKPQSKETGIVMLADSVEAASRTLEEPTHQRYKDLVTKIIEKKLADGQLDETPLTLRELRVIAERFTTTLLSINHNRIPYPDQPGAEKASLL